MDVWPQLLLRHLETALVPLEVQVMEDVVDGDVLEEEEEQLLHMDGTTNSSPLLSTGMLVSGYGDHVGAVLGGTGDTPAWPSV